MVSTDRPKANATPRRPIPTSGKAAAMTALPQPAKVSQKVPMPSATHLCRLVGLRRSMESSLDSSTNLRATSHRDGLEGSARWTYYRLTTVPRARPPGVLHEHPFPTVEGDIKAQVRTWVAQ